MIKRALSIALLCLGAAKTYAQLPSEESAQLIKNYSFEEEAKPIRNRRFGPNGEGELFGGPVPAGVIPGWILPEESVDASMMDIVTEGLPDTTQHRALRWTIVEATTAAPAVIGNVGNQPQKGIKAIEGQQYVLTFWARADKRYKGTLQVGLQSKHEDRTWYAQPTVKNKIKKRWKKYTLTFTAEGNDPKARFVMTADKPGVLYLDCVSLVTED